jgi:predicted hydrocarbon binding protein
MDPIPKSGYFYANKFARITLNAYEEVMGKNGLNAILNVAGLNSLIDHYPPDNLERQFDFADFTAIQMGLEEMYGSRGGRALALRAGRATFNDALKNFGPLAGIGDLAFKALPLQEKIHIGLPAVARIFMQVTDQDSTVEENEEAFLWTIQHCPVCWARKGADKPACDLLTGLLEAMLDWVSGGVKFSVSEVKCSALGDEVCQFLIRKEPIS